MDIFCVLDQSIEITKTRSRVRVPSKGIVLERSEPMAKLTVKKSSAQRVRKHHERERQKPGYDHEKVKEETRCRVAAMRPRRRKCPLNAKINYALYIPIDDARVIYQSYQIHQR